MGFIGLIEKWKLLQYIGVTLGEWKVIWKLQFSASGLECRVQDLGFKVN